MSRMARLAMMMTTMTRTEAEHTASETAGFAGPVIKH